MSAPDRCPQCGSVLPEGRAGGGVCLACRLEMGLDAPASSDDVSPDREETVDPTVGDEIGPYRVLRRLGEGGMGVVYLAEQSEPIRRRVALKIIKRGMDTERVIARFAIERQALALMDHPAIAKVFDAGETPKGRPYFAMELADGEPIRTSGGRAWPGRRRRSSMCCRLW